MNERGNEIAGGQFGNRYRFTDSASGKATKKIQGVLNPPRMRSTILGDFTMRVSRLFKPSAPSVLEIRVVPSALAVVHLTPAEIAQSNASAAQFPLGTGATLRAGQSVAEQETIDYATGTPQTETILKVPNLAANTVTIYETINLHNDGGIEKVVETETYSGGSIPLSGPDITFNITTTVPDGTTQTETETEMIEGHKTFTNATIHEANGGIETVSSESIRQGHTSTTNRTIIEPYGTIEHQTTVTTSIGDFDSTSRTVTTFPGEIAVSQSVTNVIRVQPSSL